MALSAAVATALLQIRRVEVPVVSPGAKKEMTDEVEYVLVHPSRGPMAYNLGTRMQGFKDAYPGPQDHHWNMGGSPRMPLRDKGAGPLNVEQHMWMNKTATQRKIDLLTVAKKNKKFREFKGQDFCRHQEFDLLVRAIPTRLKKTYEGEGFHVGDTAELDVTEGDYAGSRILCRIFGEGSSQGLWNVRLPPQPPVVEIPLELKDMPEGILHKMRVTVWRCTYKLGMDIREGPENEGPIKNNVLRTRPTLKVGEVVRIVEERYGDGVIYLRLEDGRGWIFDQKPGVGVACIRDENAADYAKGIDVVVKDEEVITDLDVLGRRLRDADAPALVAGLQKVVPNDRPAMLNHVPEAKHTELLDHLLAECIGYTMTEYLLSKDEAPTFAIVSGGPAKEGWGAGG